MFDKAYLIRAFYQWCLDNKYHPEIQVPVAKDSNLDIPKDKIHENGTVVIDISKECVKFLEIENDKIYIQVSFDGVAHKLGIDINAVNWIRAVEVDEYLYLNNKYDNYYTAVQKNLVEEKKYEQAKAARVVGMNPDVVQNWIIDNSASLTQLLGVTDWYIKYIVVKQDDKISKQNENDPMGGCSGDCETSYQYKSATIRIFASEVKDENELKRVVIHELAHVATASLELYGKYFEQKMLYLDSEKKVAEKLRYDIYELLAMQIETIVMGKVTNNIGVGENSDIADARFRMHCQKFGITSQNIITNSNVKAQKKSPLEIIYEEKKYDHEFWYEKYRESLELVKKKRFPEESENLHSFLSGKLSQVSNSIPEIIIPGKPEEKYISNIEIILPINYKKAA